MSWFGYGTPKQNLLDAIEYVRRSDFDGDVKALAAALAEIIAYYLENEEQ